MNKPENIVNAPLLYNDRKIAEGACQRHEHVSLVSVPISPDGAYDGNGEYTVPDGIGVLSIDGFTKGEHETLWFGKGYVIEKDEI